MKSTGNRKLTRGSYYFVALGDRFYGGEHLEHRLEEINKPKWQWGKPLDHVPQYIKHYTGKSIPIIVDDFSSVKALRRASQAQRVCDSLNRRYSGTGITAVVRLYEEQASEYPRKAKRENTGTS